MPQSLTRLELSHSSMQIIHKKEPQGVIRYIAAESLYTS